MHLYVGRILCTLYSNSIIFFFTKVPRPHLSLSLSVKLSSIKQALMK